MLDVSAPKRAQIVEANSLACAADEKFDRPVEPPMLKRTGFPIRWHSVILGAKAVQLIKPGAVACCAALAALQELPPSVNVG